MTMRAHALATSTVLLLACASAASAQSQTPLSYRLSAPVDPKVFGQIDFGGRFTDVSGDQARFQRYRDLRSGAFFSIPFYHRETGTWWTTVKVQNVGYRDQRYDVTAARPGRVKFRFLYDQTPTFISADTQTPYTPRPESNGFYAEPGAALTLPDAVQASIQATPTLLRSQIEGLATGFPSRLRRDTLGFELAVDLTSQWQSKFKFQNTKKQGSIPWGATFGFSLPVEIALPIDTSTNDVDATLQWSSQRGMLRVGYDGSWFDQRVPSYTWDNPLRLVDATTGSSVGRGSEWPSNSFYYVNFGGAYRPSSKTSINGTLSLGQSSQNASLLPYTVNTALAPLNDTSSLDRLTAEARADIGAATLNVVTRPSRVFNVNARYRFTRFDNKTPEFARTQSVAYDQSVSAAGPPELQGYTRNYVDVDAAYTGLRYTTIGVGYGYYGADFLERVYFKSAENTIRASLDTVGSQYVSFRSTFEHSRRRGDGLHAAVLEEAGELPGMRHFDVGDRDRDRVRLVTNVMATGNLGVNALVAWTKEDYLNPEQPQSDAFGLLNYKTQTYGGGIDYLPGDKVGIGASYNYDKYDGLSQSRNWSNAAQSTDPNRNWTTDEAHHGHSFIAYLDLPKVIPNTEARVDYDYTRYRGRYTYGAGSAYLPSPAEPGGVAQLPALTSQEHRASLDVRYFIRRNLALGVAYWFDDYAVQDFALGSPGETVVSGIARPAIFEGQSPDSATNGIVLNYLYRPYTAQTAWLRLTYLW